MSRIPLNLNVRRAGRAFAALLLVLLSCPGGVSASDAGEAMRVLKKNCFSCHNEQKKKGGLEMMSREALLKGGEGGAAVAPGEPDDSLLITSLAAGADPHMPPKKQLSPEQIDLLTRWVRGGAPWDAEALAALSAPRQVHLAAAPPSYVPVLALALSPDATRLAVACGNEVVIYDASGPELSVATRASAHLDPVQSLAWSVDGRQLATGAFRRVVIWNAESLTVEREISDGLRDRVTALEFLPDGKQLAAADGLAAEEGTIRMVDVSTGSSVVAWSAHSDLIYDLAVSADGKLLASAGGDKLVKVWDLATRKEVAKLEGHVAQVLTLAFNADGRQLFTGGADQQLKLWDVQTKERIGALGNSKAAINAIVWTQAGPAVYAVTDAGALLRYTDFKSHTGAQSSESAQERTLESAKTTLYCVAVSAKGDRVFAGSHEGRLFVWNKDGKLVSRIDVQNPAVTASTAR